MGRGDQRMPWRRRKALQDERQILRRSIYPSMGLRLQCNIWRGARLYRRTQTAHSDVEKITKISRESYKEPSNVRDAVLPPLLTLNVPLPVACVNDRASPALL